MSDKLNGQNLGFILFKNGNLGPEQIYFEPLPNELKEKFSEATSIELGLYLSLVISQGKGLNKEGLFGPLPWYQVTSLELFLFSFLVKDPLTEDLRKKEATLCFLVVFFPRKEEALMNSRYEIEKALEDHLIRVPEKRIELNQENILHIINISKNVFKNAYESGKKISQEQALDEVISFESMELFAVYSFKNKTLKSCLIGEKEALPSYAFFEKKVTDDYQISVREHEDGSSILILEFKELDTVIYVKLNHVLNSKNLIRLLSKIDSSLEILSTYIS